MDAYCRLFDTNLRPWEVKALSEMDDVFMQTVRIMNDKPQEKTQIPATVENAKKLFGGIKALQVKKNG